MEKFKRRKKRSSTLLNLERTVTCEDWGDTAKYWKWDHVVPDSCWRKYQNTEKHNVQLHS